MVVVWGGLETRCVGRLRKKSRGREGFATVERRRKRKCGPFVPALLERFLLSFASQARSNRASASAENARKCN